MKKNFIAFGALTAVATVLAAAPSFAADPIKLSVGGNATVVTGYASQKDEYLKDNGIEATAVDVKGDNTLTFSGSTKLDNGLTVAVQYELEAGGRNEVRTDSADTYSISVGGAFGTIVAGANGTALSAIATGAPSVSKVFSGLDEGDLIDGNWVINPNANLADATFVNTSGDSESISYISPSVYGFTFGATYVPSVTGDDVVGQPSGAASVEGYGAGLMYAGTFGGLGVKAEGGYLRAEATRDYNEWQAGTTLTYAGFGFGGAYRGIDMGTDDKAVWEVGASYAVGPYAVSLSYMDSSYDAAAAGADEEGKIWELAGNYTMGPGVDLVAGVSHVSFENDANNDNDGWVVATGIALAF